MTHEHCNKDTYKLSHTLIYQQDYIVMLQQANTNTVGGNNNCNPHARRGLGGFGGQGCGVQGNCGNNTSIFKLSFEEKLRDECLHKLTITKYSH